jgi:coproporphyrinogen III oxidase
VENVFPITKTSLSIEKENPMAVRNNLSYPRDRYADLLRDFYTGINGADTFEEVKEWQSEKWSATVNCSRGDVLEKAGFAQMHMVGGVINEKPADVSFLETLVYPKNPTIPGFIIMTNMNHTEAMGKIIVFYCDLVIQDGQGHEEAKALFSSTIIGACEKHGHNFEEHNAMLIGRGLLGGIGGECGILNFFEERDVSFIEDIITAVLDVYGEILEKGKNTAPQKEDYVKMHKSRARLIEWIILEDYGVKIARDNGILSDIIEAYAFPPVIRY